MSKKNKNREEQNGNVALMSPDAAGTAGTADASDISADAPDTTGATDAVEAHATAEHSDTGRIDSPKKSGNVRKRLLVAAAAVAGVLVCAVVAAFIVMGRIAVPLTVEVGDTPDLSPYTGGLAGKICRVGGAADITTDKIGEHRLTLTFFGFVRRDVTLFVRDSVPPELEVQNVSVADGISVTPEDFVVSSSDLTSLTFRFAEPPGDSDGALDRDVVIVATDEGGNETSRSAHLIAGDPSLLISAEFGSDADDIRDMISQRFAGLGGTDLSEVDTSACGEYAAQASDGGTFYRFRVVIRDTVAPTAGARPRDLRLGETVSAEDIIGDITDLSPVTVSLDGPSDFGEPGTYTVPVNLEDDQGNSTSLEVEVRIHDVPEQIEIERGLATKELSGRLTNGDATLSLPAGFDASSLSLGENSVTLNGAYNALTVSVTVKDTVPPALVTRDVTVIANRGVSPEDFVAACTDASPVSYSFEGAVSAMNAGESTVTVAATDEAGNVTRKQAKLTVIVDSVPPVIHGIHNISVGLGESAAYSDGVYAVDDIDGKVAVSVDSSAVNTALAGSYTVRYTATDRSGNTAQATATVTVLPLSINTVYSMADSILAQITNPGMTARQRAWAIYSWCTSNIRYSTTTSYLMGNFVEAAYSGFRTRAGNCYIYYAVASCLLTRSNITNMEISRNNPADPHYWNLVQIGGAWYHFDTCPHFRSAPLTAFLLTDAQVAAYSVNNSPGYYSFDSRKYPRTP